MTDTTTLHIEEVDPSGAIAETFDAATAAAAGTTRAGFLKRAAVGAGGLTIAGALLTPTAGAAGSSGSLAHDIEILNYALTLELLEQAFYVQATKANLNGTYAKFASVVAAHETAHVKAITATIKQLGGTPITSPKFNFKGTNTKNSTFGKTALKLEETGVLAYGGQVNSIETPAVLKAAANIHSIEARHAAWIRSILGLNPAPKSFDGTASMAQILKAVKATGFIVG